MSSRDEKNLKLVEKLSNTNEKLAEDELTSILTKTYDLCRVPPLPDPNVSYNAANFAGVASEAEVSLSIVLKLLNYVTVVKKKHSQQFSQGFVRNIVVSCFLVACEYCDQSYEWSSPEAADVSRKIMNKLCDLCGCGAVTDLLNSRRDSAETQNHDDKHVLVKDGSQSFMKSILQRLSEMLNKSNWRMYPSLKMTYWWILRNTGKDDLGEHLKVLLPPALFIVDDWEDRNKVLGIQCLSHILENTAGSELRWYGRADVIYDALKPLLYSKESEILSSLYPTIIKVSEILEADPAKAGKLKHDSTLDFITHQLLQEMAYEQKLCLRSVYATALPLLVLALKLPAVRWSKELLDVCEDYLATFEGPAAQDRINILKSVEIITQEVHRLVVLLHAAAPNTVQKLCRGLQDVSVHPQCEMLLQSLHAVTMEDV
ncbi:TELO2-interacting protein 2-like isoform X2 [Portunus trituberculatus]|uniref:TELO2-interacting protein 2-like isoform X2 n=1 Tax=Portunus trituberculatus TaxID=210409 RepID=UPI001E1CEB6A|nr:TELO2-interacting protein 2-like isoform X2 [Portunus trituberculatus]